MKLLPFIFLALLSGCTKGPVNNIDNIVLIDTAVPEEEGETKETTFEKVDIPNRKITPQELKEYVGMLNNYIYQFGEKNIDTDDLAVKIGNLLIKDVSSGENLYNPDSLLRFDAKSKDGRVRIYSYGYDCGGTRRFITHPIVYWTDNGKTYAFNLSEYIYCWFTEIHRLSDSLYILTGGESGSGFGSQGIVYVLEIKNNVPNAKYKAFVNRPYLNIWDAGFSYNGKTKTLSAKKLRLENLNDQFKWNHDDYGKDSLANYELLKMMAPEFYEQHAINLKFRNGVFTASKYKPNGSMDYPWLEE